MADRSEVLELLRIADISKQWPHLKAIHDHAMELLVKAAGDHAPKPPAPVETPAAADPVATGEDNG